jgi:hypothetical protein
MSSRQIFINLCRNFQSRAEAQGYKGKTRDKMLIEFFVGACSALEESDNRQAAAYALRFTALLFCTRGYSELEAELKKHDDELKIANSPKKFDTVTLEAKP